MAKKSLDRFTSEVADAIEALLTSSPDCQVSSRIRSEAQQFFATPKSLGQVYDFASQVSLASVKDVTPSVRKACAVSSSYCRPVDNFYSN